MLLDPENFLRVLCPLKAPLGSQNTVRGPSSIDACYTHFSVDYTYSWDHVLYLHKGHPIKENQQHVSIKKNPNLFKE